MSATITDILKSDILTDLFNSTQNINTAIGDSDRFYLAIGRSEEWDSDVEPPVPNSSRNEVLNFQASIQSMKLVPDVSYVVPRYNWTAGNQYEAWDRDYNSNTVVSAAGDIQNPYYVITDDNNVFLCIQQGKIKSTGIVRNSLYKPTDTTGEPFSAGDDGYVWRFLFNIGTAESRKFLTSQYMPVEQILDSSVGGPAFGDLSVSRVQQLGIQQNAVKGQMLGIAVDSGGVGFKSEPTITIQAVPLFGETIVEAQAYANVVNERITEVIMKSDSTASSFSFGQNYYDAAIIVTGGGGGEKAKLRALITNDSGMGANPVIDLNSSAIMFNAQLDGTENGDFQVTNDFRQIGIIRNPLKDSAQFNSFPATARDSAATSPTLSAFKELHVTTGTLNSENITGDQIVSQSSGTLATAIVDYYDGNGVLYVHQTRETGFAPFDSGASVTISEGGGTASTVGVGGLPVLRPSEVDRFSGEVLYIDNRSPVARDNEQTEDIKVVIDL